MSTTVRISSPCRIHFGLLSLEKNAKRRFGGAGVMLEEPKLEIVFSLAEEDRVSGELSHRAEEFIELWRDHTGVTGAVRCEIVSSAPEHVGLGLGTQLGLSIAWGLDSLFDREDVDLKERAMSVGRGLRSAVGTYGFRDGGFIVDDGKTSQDSLGQLHERILIPNEWRVLLVRPHGITGLAGKAEMSAFDSMVPVSEEIRETLRRELYDRMVPAAREGDFESFSESVYQYGYSAGECFSANQGGPFLTAAIAEFVCFCRERGVPGVGQSSWGPTVFCWFPNEGSSQEFLNNELAEHANFPATMTVSRVAQHGATRAKQEDE